jgi:hypothetical protein
MAKSKDMTSFDRMTQVAVGKGIDLGAADDTARELFPELWKWLSTTEAGPDHLKDPARLTMKLVPGGCLVSLSDDAYGVSLDASSDTLANALTAIEQALRSPQPAFRQWNRDAVKVRKKKKEGGATS